MTPSCLLRYFLLFFCPMSLTNAREHLMETSCAVFAMPTRITRMRSYYEEQFLTPDKKHEGKDILIADITPPHESV